MILGTEVRSSDSLAMWVVRDRAEAIVLIIVSLWCLGSWPLFFNILERRGRLPQHTYLDYAITTYLVAIGFALTLGEFGPVTPETPRFTTQLFQENGSAVAFALAGGLALCAGNILMQYSLAFVGISLTEVVSASLAVVGGTTVNYFLDKGLNRAEVLFPGVGCFVVAVCLGSFCHASNAADIQAKLSNGSSSTSGYRFVEPDGADPKPTDPKRWGVQSSIDTEQGSPTDPLVSKNNLAEIDASQLVVGSAEFLKYIEESRAIKVKGSKFHFGLLLASLCGLCYSLFSPLFNIATNDQFHLLKPGVPHLVVYTTFFYFSTAFFICAVCVNVYFLYHPILGLPKSTLSAYFRDFKGRDLAVMAGLVCGFGNGFQFMGGQAAGYAAADAVQALPLVGTFWGVVLFGEYHKSSRRTYIYLAGMLVMFTVAVSILIASAGSRC